MQSLLLVKQWSVPSVSVRKPSHWESEDYDEPTLRIDCVVFNAQGTLLASGGVNRHCHLWRVPSGAPYGSAMNVDCPITSLSFSHDGTLLAACGSEDPTIQVWRVHDQHRILNVVWTADTRVVSFAPPRRAFTHQALLQPSAVREGSNPDTSLPAVASRSSSSPQRPVSSIKGIALSPSLAAVSSSDGVADWIPPAAPSPGKHLLAVGDVEGTISLWTVEVQANGTATCTLQAVPSHGGMSLGVTPETNFVGALLSQQARQVLLPAASDHGLRSSGRGQSGAGACGL